jgi:hypothetical protein
VHYPQTGTNASATAARANEKAEQDSRRTRSSIKVEMEDICDWPTDMTISIQPDGDSWKVAVLQEGAEDAADRREMVEQIAARLKLNTI